MLYPHTQYHQVQLLLYDLNSYHVYISQRLRWSKLGVSDTVLLKHILSVRDRIKQILRITHPSLISVCELGIKFHRRAEQRIATMSDDSIYFILTVVPECRILSRLYVSREYNKVFNAKRCNISHYNMSNLYVILDLLYHLIGPSIAWC